MSNIIFITGASSDIGIELIKNIQEECLIIAHYNSSDAKLLEIKNSIKKNTLVTLKADFSSEEDINRLLDEIESKYGVPNKIIHLAAPKFENIRFKSIVWNDFQKLMDVSLKSLVIILNRFLPKLAVEQRGKVVCLLSSVTLNVPPKAVSHYTTVKYALLGFLKAIASEYGEKKITVNSISPSMIDTKFLSQINERIVEMVAQGHPLKRNAAVADIIPVILLLLSEDSAYINGVNIPVTGGSYF